jgi:hypothetical protein
MEKHYFCADEPDGEATTKWSENWNKRPREAEKPKAIKSALRPMDQGLARISHHKAKV